MAHLRIVTWNCGMALARKAPSLLALNPDIAVVQECSKKSVDVLHTLGLSGLWFGGANPNKGVAVFCSNKFTFQAKDELFGKWVVPVRVHGAVDFNLLAIWACPVGTKRADNYIGQVFRCLVEHRGWFRKTSCFNPRLSTNVTPGNAGRQRKTTNDKI
jgi:exodeoxyribonuclease-3